MFIEGSLRMVFMHVYGDLTLRKIKACGAHGIQDTLLEASGSSIVMDIIRGEGKHGR